MDCRATDLMKINQDVKQNTFFKELFNTLLQISNEYPSVKSKDGRPSNSPEEFDHVRRRYAKIAVLNEIVNTSLAFISNNHSMKQSGNLHMKILHEVSQASTLINLQSYMQPLNRISHEFINEEEIKLDNVKHHPFGIDKNSIKSKALSLLTNKHKEVLRERVQRILVECCNQIISFSFPDEEFLSPSEGMAAVVKLVSQQKKNVDSERILLTTQRQHNSTLMKLVIQQLIEYGNALQSLVEKHRFSDHPLPHLQFFSASNKTYLLKLKCLEMEAMTSTYNKGTVLALKKLRKEVDLANEEILKELAQIEHRLSAYEGLDPKFHELLREYVSLQKDIQFFKV